MDIASLSMGLSVASLQNAVSIEVLSKAMDTNEVLGSGLVNMIDAAAMEQSVNPHIGGNMDIRI